ncbi:MAG: hypothetical protein QIT45_gp15 [Methanophagales virus PBV266]|uniref:Uncharacterized protein n=1 Tax=Methanophagales virus PBV266 TaxID=3071308 RepID=A0AA46TE11_9VIRU|nr:MAG: hypothetical protein QIT45_gp15 [Methanophagales virus PBV266]UYL65028.1 MAG: hypothetical protein BDLDGNHF_00015 [Methanophagales virus PBV266]
MRVILLSVCGKRRWKKMVVVIKEEDAGKVVKALVLKRRIRELERQIAELQRRKADLEEEYEDLSINIE